MEYSIIIPYRDRESHLIRLLPVLQDMFISKDYEIIIAEQSDNEKFKKALINNIASEYATGKFLIFHDVDHIPNEENVDYFKIQTQNLDVWYPVYNVIYVNEEDGKLILRPMDDVPPGYRNHRDKVHDDHFGGVFECTREAFKNIKGYNPYFIGWGCEDSDIRNRFTKRFGKIVRAEIPGTFYALYHTDNKPDDNDPDFKRNQLFQFAGQIGKYDTEKLNKTSIDDNVKETFEFGNNIRHLHINTVNLLGDYRDQDLRDFSKKYNILK